MLTDPERDALALVAAMARRDKEACDVILAQADLGPVAAQLASLVVLSLLMSGLDPVEYVANMQRMHVQGIASP